MSEKKLKYTENGKTIELEFAVVGVTFENRQDILKRIYPDFLNKIKIPIRLESDPENQYDKNAIKVILNSSNEIIGYVSKDFNEDIIPVLNDFFEGYISSIYMTKSRNFGIAIKCFFKD